MLTDTTIYDAAVVGGGPAGSVFASFLARDGHRVLLVDKARFPRPKPCGDAISGKSVGVLRELGLQETVEDREHVVVDSILFSSPSGHVVTIPFPASVSPQARTRRYDYISEGYVVRRDVFDTTLLEHARSQPNVATLEDFDATDLLIEDGQACGIVGRADGGTERTIRARMVIGADGATSMVAKRVGVFERDPEHWLAAYRSYFRGVSGLDTTLEIHFIEDVLPGYFWIFPVAEGLANVGIGMLESEIKKSHRRGSRREINLRRSMYRVIAEHPMFKGRFAEATELVETRKGWLLPAGSKRRVIHGNGWLLLGDAAALIDPFSGEGIGNAMVSARLAAEVAHDALVHRNERPTAADLMAYPALLWREIGDELRSSHRLQRVVKHRRLVDFVIGRAVESAEVRRIISAMMTEYDQKEQLGDLRFYLKLLRLKLLRA